MCQFFEKEVSEVAVTPNVELLDVLKVTKLFGFEKEKQPLPETR